MSATDGLQVRRIRGETFDEYMEAAFNEPDVLATLPCRRPIAFAQGRRSHLVLTSHHQDDVDALRDVLDLLDG